MIANLSDKKAVVIDATCEIDNAIDTLANENGLEITAFIETRMHADHLSGATKLVKKYGSSLYISSLEQYVTKSASENGITTNLIKTGDKIVILEMDLSWRQFILRAILMEAYALNFR